jgi:transposase
MSPLYNTGMDRRITLSQKQLNRANVLSRLVSDSDFTIQEAAQAMGLSERQTKRLKGEYRKSGIDALVHKNIGRQPVHAISEETRNRIIDLKKSSLFANANFLFFQELLARYGINISYSSLHSILISAGIRSVKTRRPSKKHRRRKRKAKEGIMLQMDASPFDWLNIGQELSLHGAIDDATSKVTALYLCRHECLQGYFEIMRNTIASNGIPMSIYADRHTIFCSPKDGKLTVAEELKGIQVKDTQFGRALRQLGITLLKARSGPAKGRVERLWETLQGRLPIEFALAGIRTIDEANEFLASYIHRFNSMFAVDPEDIISAYRPVSAALNIDYILCVVEQRSFDKGGVFSFYNRHFLLSSDNNKILPSNGRIDVLVSPRFGIKVCYLGVIFDVIQYVKPEKACKPEKQKRKGPYVPPDSHYFKYGHSLIKKVTFEDDDRSILKMLEKIFLGKMDDAI